MAVADGVAGPQWSCGVLGLGVVLGLGSSRCGRCWCPLAQCTCLQDLFRAVSGHLVCLCGGAQLVGWRQVVRCLAACEGCHFSRGVCSLASWPVCHCAAVAVRQAQSSVLVGRTPRQLGRCGERLGCQAAGLSGCVRKGRPHMAFKLCAGYCAVRECAGHPACPRPVSMPAAPGVCGRVCKMYACLPSCVCNICAPLGSAARVSALGAVPSVGAALPTEEGVYAVSSMATSRVQHCVCARPANNGSTLHCVCSPPQSRSQLAVVCLLLSATCCCSCVCFAVCASRRRAGRHHTHCVCVVPTASDCIVRT